MVDVHCHILPGIDDGAADIQESLAMAQSAINDGVTHVVATPHSSAEYRFDYDRVRQLHGQLQRLIGDRLVLATGCDFHLNIENLEALRQRCATVLSQSAKLFAGRVQRLFDSTEYGAHASRHAIDGAASDHHASGAQCRSSRRRQGCWHRGFDSDAMGR